VSRIGALLGLVSSFGCNRHFAPGTRFGVGANSRTSMSTDSGQDDLPKILARAFLRAWEQYYEADSAGKLSEDVARPLLTKFLVAFAKEGMTDEGTLAVAGLGYLIRLTRKPTTSKFSTKKKEKSEEGRRTPYCVNGKPAKFLPQWQMPWGAQRLDQETERTGAVDTNAKTLRRLGRDREMLRAQDAEIEQLSDRVSRLTMKIDSLKGTALDARAAIGTPRAAPKQPAAQPSPRIFRGGAPLVTIRQIVRLACQMAAQDVGRGKRQLDAGSESHERAAPEPQPSA
jgi:hypothetical protein